MTGSRPLSMAMAAIIVSATPMGLPTRSKSPEMRPASSAARWSKGNSSLCDNVARKAFRRLVACVRWKPLTISITETLEKVCIETVESGYMTRDLSVMISAEQPWLSTQAFLAKLDENLQKAMK